MRGVRLGRQACDFGMGGRVGGNGDGFGRMVDGTDGLG